MQRFRNSFRRSSICRRTYRRKTDKTLTKSQNDSFYNKNGVLEIFEDDQENSAKLERKRYDSLPDIALTDEFQERKKLMKRAVTISQGDNVFSSRHVSDKSSNVAEKDQFCWTSVFGTANSLAIPPTRNKFTTFQIPTKINKFYELSSDVNSNFSGRLPTDMKTLTEPDYQKLLVPQKKPPKISFNDQTDFTKTFFVTDLEEGNSSDNVDYQEKVRKKETIFWNDMSISHKLIEIDVKGTKVESIFTKL